MRTRRLKHAADTICQIFCGWRLINSKAQLVELGSGTIRIDVLSGDCLWDGRPVPSLSIAGEVHLWFLADLEANGIPVEAITRAVLEAKLSFSTIPRGDGVTGEEHFSDGRLVWSDTVQRCVIRCECEIATDEHVYRSQVDDVEEWPVGWPHA